MRLCASPLRSTVFGAAFCFLAPTSYSIVPLAISNCPDVITFNHCDGGFFDFDVNGDNEPFAFEIVAGLGEIDPETGEWSWTDESVPMSGSESLEVKVTDNLGGFEVCTVPIQVTNRPPTCRPKDPGPITAWMGEDNYQVIVIDDSDSCDSLSMTVLPGSDFSPTSVEVRGDTVFFRPEPSARAVILEIEISDGELTSTCEIMFNACACFAPPTVVIGKSHLPRWPDKASIPIEFYFKSTLFSLTEFNFKLAYDARLLNLMQVIPGDLYDSCNWEYFTYRIPDQAGCGEVCPSGRIQIQGIADLVGHRNNYATLDESKTCLTLPAARMSIVELEFQGPSLNSHDGCEGVPLQFWWENCDDNTLRYNYSGDEFMLSERVFDNCNPHLGTCTSFSSIEDPTAGFPTYFGQQGCVVYFPEPPPYKLDEIWFVNGGFENPCVEDWWNYSGDINCNGFEYEISDYLMFSNYFVAGLAAFGTHVECSIASSDINGDGLTLSLIDLVSMFRVIRGDPPRFDYYYPFAKSVRVNASVTTAGGLISVDTEVGVALITLKGTGSPQLLAENAAHIVGGDEEQTRVLIMPQMDGGTFSGDLLQTDQDLIDIEMYTYDGQQVEWKAVPQGFAVQQNYPNPFNPTTTIAFTTGPESEYEIVIYNVTGQVVERIEGVSKTGQVTHFWNPRGLASGVYFYRVTSAGQAETRKALLLK